MPSTKRLNHSTLRARRTMLIAIRLFIFGLLWIRGLPTSVCVPHELRAVEDSVGVVWEVSLAYLPMNCLPTGNRLKLLRPLTPLIHSVFAVPAQRELRVGSNHSFASAHTKSVDSFQANASAVIPHFPIPSRSLHHGRVLPIIRDTSAQDRMCLPLELARIAESMVLYISGSFIFGSLQEDVGGLGKNFASVFFKFFYQKRYVAIITSPNIEAGNFPKFCRPTNHVPGEAKAICGVVDCFEHKSFFGGKFGHSFYFLSKYIFSEEEENHNKL
jgi:hypothetical protein